MADIVYEDPECVYHGGDSRLKRFAQGKLTLTGNAIAFASAEGNLEWKADDIRSVKFLDSVAFDGGGSDHSPAGGKQEATQNASEPGVCIRVVDPDERPTDIRIECRSVKLGRDLAEKIATVFGVSDSEGEDELGVF